MPPAPYLPLLPLIVILLGCFCLLLPLFI
jgi:hypothetical protein